GFGTAAERAGRFGDAAARYAHGWAAYPGGSHAPPASVAGDAHLRRIYEQSLMVPAASEDRRHAGGSIASPTRAVVWGTLTLENHDFSGPYHLVRPRDSYHVATAQRRPATTPAAVRLMDYLWRVQKPDGSWWQDTRLDGTPYWTASSSTRWPCGCCSPGCSAARRGPTGSTSAPPRASSTPTGRRRRRSLRVETPHGPVWYRFTFDGYGETAAGGTGTSSRRPSARRSGGSGCCRRASAASTSCSRAATRPRTCGRSREPRTTG
ncbi:MAG TPA: hypothetical protein VN213_10160, partial [Solirubrobacteraceae bacterium]|nr:hypothetical protein [Solirubrobacteraceae bacterium]